MSDSTQIIRRGNGAPVLIVEDIATEAFTLRKLLAVAFRSLQFSLQQIQSGRASLYENYR